MLLALGMYVRLSVTESPVFTQAAQDDPGRQRVPLLELLRRPRNLLLACAVGIGPFALTALISTYMISYATMIGYHRTDVMTALIFTSTTALLCIPLFSALSDRVGRRPIIVAGSTGSQATTRELMKVVSRLPKGVVVLPNIDVDLDNDGDDIPDTQDRCPLEAETLNGVDDEDGYGRQTAARHVEDVGSAIRRFGLATVGELERLAIRRAQQQGGCQPGETDTMGDVEKSYLWVANTDQGSVSKVNTLTLIEEARYRTGPSGGTESPSRTAVSLDGRFVIVNNRGTGSSAVIAANLDDCKDKNGNGTIETSKNKNDLLAWQADECLMWSVQHPFKGDIGSGPRGVTWTPGTFDQVDCVFKDPKIWVGFLPVANATAHMVRLDGMTGAVEETLVINNWTQGDTFWGPYGAALDKDKNVWFTGLRGELFRINTANNPATFDRWTPPPGTESYGMTVDPDGDPWMAGCQGPLTTFDPDTNQFTAVPGTNACYRGIAADKEGGMWVASNGNCGVMQINHVTNTVIQFHNLAQCLTPVGVSTDLEGFVWLVDENLGAWKIDPLAPNNKTLVNITGDHYTYSDMTGGQLKSVIQPQ